MSRRPRRRPPRWAASITGAVLLSGSLAGLQSSRFQRADVRVGDLLRRSRSPVGDGVITAATDLGSMYGALGTAAALAVTGHRRLAVDVAGVGAAAWTVAQVAKTRVRRERPYEADAVERLIRPPTGSSYPSGHATVAAATMAVVADAGGPRVRALTGVLSGFVALSRVYVGVHYPSDVAGGAGLGVLLARVWPVVRWLVA